MKLTRSSLHAASATRKFLRGLCAGALALSATLAQAAPTTYNFTSAAGPYGSASVIGLFSPTDTVSGSFIYDPASPATGTGSLGVTIYGNAAGTLASYSSLTGTAGSYSFSDVRGYVTVSNDQPLTPGGPGLDQVQLYADSSLSGGIHNLIGFTAGGYTLVNVRIFWNEGNDSIPDFLTDQSLPGAPPSYAARLSLDFVPTDNPTLPATNYVFFTNIQVTPAPTQP